ncbi:MAG: ABC transporter ATP-binding protein [Planctomycetota bacterium]
MTDFAIRTQNLNKKYRLYASAADRLRELAARGRRKLHREVWALRDINLQVEKGSSLGVVGSNGAGKSTLLKILAGTTQQTAGTFEVRGTVASLIELGTGFHAGFTGRQNIYLSAAIIGLRRQEIKSKLGEIIDFSELGPFIDAPVRTYSSGMVMRLGFSVATAVDPDVLMIDEILAVGDLHFQKKCIDRIFELKSRGKSILLCSHSLYDVRQVCETAVWLRDGMLQRFGDAALVTHAYAEYERSRFRGGRPASAVADAQRHQDRADSTPRIGRVRIVNQRSESISVAHLGDDIAFEMDYTVPPDCKPLTLGLGFFRADGIPIATMGTHLMGVAVPIAPGEYTARVMLPHIRLMHGEFHVQGYLVDDKAMHFYDHAMVSQPLVIEQTTKEVGMFLMDHQWSITKCAAVRG